VPKGGYDERRSPTFVGIPPVASRASSRSPTFGVVREWFSAFLSRFLSASMEAFVVDRGWLWSFHRTRCFLAHGGKMGYGCAPRSRPAGKRGRHPVFCVLISSQQTSSNLRLSHPLQSMRQNGENGRGVASASRKSLFPDGRLTFRLHRKNRKQHPLRTTLLGWLLVRQQSCVLSV
jgi:hypothetical protein